MRELKLFCVSTSTLQPLATASLACLASLTLRQALQPNRRPLALHLALSSNAAATLRVLDVSYCASLNCIDAVRSCSQLKVLRMPGVCASCLSPLAACSQLEEVWMADNAHVTSLVPLKACPKLRKLDLRGCNPVLRAQVADLRLSSCPELADTDLVVLEGLVNELQRSMPPGVQKAAVCFLRRCTDAERVSGDVMPLSWAAIAAAHGAIPSLVQLLGPESSSDLQVEVARALCNLAKDGAQMQADIVAAGAIPPLVQLLGRGISADVQHEAARALWKLAAGHAHNQAVIAAAIQPLVQLLGPDSTARVQEMAAAALRALASQHVQNKAAIAAAGAIRPLVLLLGPEPAKMQAAAALRALSYNHVGNQTAISAAGAIPALKQLLGPDSSAHVYLVASGALRNLTGASWRSIQCIGGGRPLGASWATSFRVEDS
ncbi:hypothetical protein FOA52_009398 [Chlamydomonas sp. UWO 241]|nr:hypothetical protein FOA52_009398 [Chlamydomonas sp. UWO 241]